MSVFIASFAAFLLLALSLALGLLLGRAGVSGSCGGLNRIPGLKGSCGACGTDRCPRRAGDPTYRDDSALASPSGAVQ
jgi:hypothetical protein